MNQEKYLKYKNKYLNLKTQIGGEKTLEEAFNFVLEEVFSNILNGLVSMSNELLYESKKNTWDNDIINFEISELKEKINKLIATLIKDKDGFEKELIKFKEKKFSKEEHVGEMLIGLCLLKINPSSDNKVESSESKLTYMSAQIEYYNKVNKDYPGVVDIFINKNNEKFDYLINYYKNLNIYEIPKST